MQHSLYQEKVTRYYCKGRDMQMTQQQSVVVVFVVAAGVFFSVVVVVSCHRPFLPGTFLEPTAILTAQASSFSLQYEYIPYYVWRS
jgi:hypothetical protein